MAPYTPFFYLQVTAQSSESQPLQYLYIVLKLVALASVISILYMSEVIRMSNSHIRMGLGYDYKWRL